jgi:hypothetical protein
MNLAPLQVEHSHGDGMRRPLQVSDKRDRASGVSSVGDHVKNDARVAVEELDAELQNELPSIQIVFVSPNGEQLQAR